MRFVVRADRNERNAMAALEARDDRERAEKHAANPAPAPSEGAGPTQNV
jgi:hypothetical protein